MMSPYNITTGIYWYLPVLACDSLAAQDVPFTASLTTMLAFAFTHVLCQVESGILWCLHGLAIMHTKLGQNGLEKLGLPHRHLASLMVAFDFHDEKILELTQIRHLKSIAQRTLGRIEELVIAACDYKVIDV